MSDLKTYLKLRGITQQKIAKGINRGHHTICKVINRTTYKTKKRGIRIRECRPVREEIAAFLGVPYGAIWGPKSTKLLQNLIAIEIERSSERLREDLQTRYLNITNRNN